MNVGSFSATDSLVEYDKPETVAPKKKRLASKLNGAMLWKKLYNYYESERERQRENRLNMAIDEDYADAKQWDPEDAAVLAARGQAALVFDRISTPVAWVTGSEKRMKKDYKVVGREQSDMAIADVKTNVLKYLRSVNNVKRHSSRAFEDAVKAGIGWTEEYYDPETDQKVCSDYVWWREVYHDSRDRSDDLSKARYWIRVKYVELDTAIDMFPDKEDILRLALTKGQDNAQSEWYLGEQLTDPDSGSNSFGERGGYIFGEVAERRQQDLVKLIEVRYKTFESGKEKIRFAILTENVGGIVVDVPNPYDHGHFGVVPRYCYRRASDNMPYGLIRKGRDAQDDYNKNRSKIQWILATNQIKMTEGAVEDIERLREEAARPDGILEYKQGHELALGQDKQLADAHLRLLQLDAEQLEAGMGVTDENMGRTTNAVSGVAIQGRQNQGAVIMENVFSMMRAADNLQGRLQLSLMEQFIDSEMTVRIIGKSGNYEFIRLNYTNENGQIENHLTGSQADFELEEMEQSAVARQAFAGMLIDLASRVAPTLPQAAQVLSYASLHMVDMPFQQQMLAELARVMGMRDPTKAPTPEEEAQMQQEKQAQAVMAAAQTKQAMDKMDAEIALVKAQGSLTIENVKKATAETIDKHMEGMYSAIQAAMQLALNPPAAAIADSLLSSSIKQPGVEALPVQAQPMQEPQPQEIPALDQQPATPGVGQNAGINPEGMP